ncbi:MAG: nitroreductase family protein [Stomatobaculum sp.]
MDFIELAKARYSCRKLSDRAVEREKLEKILDAAQAAPTAHNNQPYRIWIIESEDAKKKLAQINTYTFGAPLFMIVGGSKEEGWVREYDGENFAAVDATIVATHMMLEIHALGLGTTWVGRFDAPKMKELFPQMEGYELVAIFPIGYPREDAHPAHLHSERKERGEIAESL